MTKRSTHSLCIALLGSCLSLSSHSATFNQLYVFGDSLSDSGNFHGYRATNGAIWVESLSTHLGAQLNNHAYVGATTGWDNPELNSRGLSGGGLQWQLTTFSNAYSAGDLVSVWAGANDFLQGRNPVTAASNIGTALDSLYAQGARDILVANLPDMGATPALHGGPAESVATSFTQTFNTEFTNVLTAFKSSHTDANLYSIDAYALFGTFTVNSQAWSNLFWTQDGFHPSSVGHQLIYDAAKVALVAPVPLPTSFWLFASSLAVVLGMAKATRRRFRFMGRKPLTLGAWALTLATASTQASAALVSYRIDALGNVLATSSIRTYEGSRMSLDFWELDGSNNTVRLSGNGGAGPRTLNTSAFAVTDITNITLTQGNQAWVTTSKDKGSYKIDSFGNVLSYSALNYYEGDRNSYDVWTLNLATDSIALSNTGNTFRPINTSLFTANDIQNITLTQNNLAWLTTTNSSTSFRIDSSGNVVSTSPLRFFEGSHYAFDFWTLDGANNTITYNGSGGAGARVLNTSAFTINNILDVTYTLGNTAWILVNEPVAPVPLPTAAWLFLSSLGGMALVARRRRQSAAA